MAVCSDDDAATPPEPPIRTAQHELLLLPGMKSMLSSVVSDVEAARERVLIETYIYANDKLGRDFGEALARAAARGVDTRLLYDPLGSQKTDPVFFDGLRAKGVDVRAYRPARTLFGGGTVWPRDHSRVIVIDQRAYTGGAAWADEWLPKDHGGKGWHDVCMRLEGPSVRDFHGVFEQRWREATGEVDAPRDFATNDRYPDLELVADTTGDCCLVYERHRAAIQRAQRRIWMENSYFFPTPDMLKDLYDAAARGVEVHVILPGESDLMVMKRAGRSEFIDWIEHGLAIWEYQKCMTHAKFAVIDDDWCTVGTFNANPTSLAMTNEVNVFVFDPAFVARVAKLFEADRADSVRVTRESVEARPVIERAVDQLAADFINTVDVLMNNGSK